MDDDLSIKTLIRAVTDELIASRNEREAAGAPAVFEVQDLTLEISFVATTSKEVGGGFHFWVVKADGSVKYDAQSVHRIVLTLKAAEGGDTEQFGQIIKGGKLQPKLKKGGPE